MFQKILIGTDGSESAYRALDYAVEFAKKWDAELLILTVIPAMVLPHYVRTRPVMVELDKALGEAHQRIMNETAKKVEDDHPEINFSTLLKKGRPPEVIVEVGSEEGADLIVMGSRGIGGVSAFLGSTSRQVVATWTKPIFLVR